MPEGHTIHRLALDLTRDLAGETVQASSPQGRFLEAARADGKKLVAAEANGKHLFLRFSRGVIHIHLGLFGRFRRKKTPPPEPRGAIRLRLVGPTYTWDLSGPTCCEWLAPKGLRELHARLGADPLDASADPEVAWQKIQKSKRAIGAVLLDQSVFAGIGNVYRAEILFLMRLHPEMPVNLLTRDELERLWSLTRELLTRGVAEKRIVTRDAEPSAKPDTVTASTSPGAVTSSARAKRRRARGEALWIYKVRTCRVCAGSVGRWPVANRTMYACARCQPLRLAT
jgi:formamidopyrimidine-DNA glycosylase